MKLQRIGFIAASTCLPRSAKKALRRTADLLEKALGTEDAYFSPHLFSSDDRIDHVSASAEARTGVFRSAIRELDLIVSVAGGTGAEDLLTKIDRKDYRLIRERRVRFIGFSDFTFMLNQIYYAARVPVIYFPSLRLCPSNLSQLVGLLTGEEITYRGTAWLTPPPPRKLSGIPIGGNLSTFVNFLNRIDPPKFSWRRHILFFEDVGIDVEDLHRSLAALRRHDVFKRVKGIVVGSLAAYSPDSAYKKRQREALSFVKNYLEDVLAERRRAGCPLPILAVSNFGHNIRRNPMAIPVGGRVTISRNRNLTFRLNGGRG